MRIFDLNIQIVEHDAPTDEEILSSYIDDILFEDAKGNKKINENAFARCFSETNNLQYHNGLFYSRSGKDTEEMLLKYIWESLEDINYNTDVERTTKKLMGAVKLASTVEKFHHDDFMIPFSNGDLDIRSWTFYLNRYSPTAYRLKVPLEVELKETPNFTKWLHDLFMPEDIETIRQYLGYCLVPTTKAQKALFLVGEGGAGKSVLGVILEELLGNAVLSTPNTQEFMTDKFKLAELEHKLVLYDDDLDSAALQGTGLYKKLITNTISLMAERKYAQPFKFTPYAKLVSCCNEMLTSEYDNTDGFFRRLLPIKTKPKQADFKPDLFFYDKIRKEAPGIVQWALLGLMHLQERDFNFVISERTNQYLSVKKNDGNPYPLFFSETYKIEPGVGSISTKQMYLDYQNWSRANDFPIRGKRDFYNFVIDNAEAMGIKSDNNLIVNGTHVRGYKNLTHLENHKI